MKKNSEMMLENEMNMTYFNDVDRTPGHFPAPLGAGEQRGCAIIRQFRGEGVIAQVASRRSLMMTRTSGGDRCRR